MSATTTEALPEPGELMKRIAQLEGEILKLRKTLRRMKDQRPPSHEDDIVAA